MRSLPAAVRAPSSIVATILAAKLCLFLFLLGHHPAGFYPPDAESYLVPANDLLEYGTFTHHGQPVLFRTPGYSLLLAPIVSALGTSRGHYVVVIHLLLSVITAGMVYACVRLLGGERKEAIVALAVVLLDPAMVMGEFAVATETLYTTLITASVLAAAWFYQGQRRWAPLAAGLFLTAATFVRPIALYLGVTVLTLMAWQTLRRKQWTRVLVVAFAVAVNLAAIGAWEARNVHSFGERIFSSVAGRNLYAYNAAAVEALAEGKDYRAVQAAHLEDRVSENPAVQARYEERRGLEILLRHPGATFLVTLKGFAVNLLEPGTGALLNLLGLRESGSGLIYKFQNMPAWSFLEHLWKHELPFLLLTALGGLWVLSIWTLALLGLPRAWRDWSPTVHVMAAIVLYHLVLSAGPASTFRFRTPVVPVLAIFVSRSFYSLRDRLSRARANRVRPRIRDTAT